MVFNTIVGGDTVIKTAAALKERGFDTTVVETGAQALEKIKELIPAQASVMNGSSKTLQQIGFVDYLKSGVHGWNNLHEAILAETDPVKQSVLRKQSVISDYFLYSALAVTQEGEIVFANAAGSALPSLAYTSDHIIIVVSTKKIVPTLNEAFSRVREHVLPLEDQRMKDMGMGGSMTAKWLILEQESPKMGRTVHIILVNEDLGF